MENDTFVNHIYALIVGIYEYDGRADLKLPGTSAAIDFTQWLLDYNVPAKNIYLSLACEEPLLSKADALEVQRFPPTDRKIRDFIESTLKHIHRDLPKTSPSTFFFYWHGHGCMIENNGHIERALITSDTSDNSASYLAAEEIQNKIFNEFTKFSRQIFFIDTCASSIPEDTFLHLEKFKFKFLQAQDIDSEKIQKVEQYNIFAAQLGQVAYMGYFSTSLLDLIKETSPLALEIASLLPQLHSELSKKLREGEKQKIDWRFQIGKPNNDWQRETISPPVLDVITVDTFQKAQKYANKVLKVIEDYKMESTKEEYEYVVNSTAFIGHLPEWHHLYMEEYGAFPRSAEEVHLKIMISNLLKLFADQLGLHVHIISGIPGSGKSTLAKRILRRLVMRNHLDDDPSPQYLKHDRLEDDARLQNLELDFFELKLERIEVTQIHEIQKSLGPSAPRKIYIIFIDDFLIDESEAPEGNKNKKIFAKLASLSERLPIYLLVTTPGENQEIKRDMGTIRNDFPHVPFDIRPLNGVALGTNDKEMLDNDKNMLLKQYSAIYGSNCQQELIEHIRNATDLPLAAIKLSIHHNMPYSQYLKERLKIWMKDEPEYLTALLLSCLLARFYVHLPLSLLKELNEKKLKEKQKLPETPEQYINKEYHGLMLFNRTLLKKNNPTLAPFNDRIAQVIYVMWKGKEVPLFEEPIEQVKEIVYLCLKENSIFHSVLANIFRGHLWVANRPADNGQLEKDELKDFTTDYGPIKIEGKGNRTHYHWTLYNSPVAAYRWINYARNHMENTSDFRASWEKALNESLSEKMRYNQEIIELYLLLAFLNPLRFKNAMDWENLISLNSNYSQLILGVLKQSVENKSFSMEALEKYLTGLVQWLDAHSNASVYSLSFSPSIRYSVIATLAKSSFINSRSSMTVNLIQILSHILSEYLKNLNFEYTMNKMLGRDVRPLVRKIYLHRDVSYFSDELAYSLLAYIQNEQSNARAGAMEILLALPSVTKIISIDNIFDLFCDICEKEEGNKEQNDDEDWDKQTEEVHSSITYTAFHFRNYLDKYHDHHLNKDEYKSFLKKVLERLENGDLDVLQMSDAYPDFVTGLIIQLKKVYYRQGITQQELFTLLRPLVENGKFASFSQTSYAFEEANKLYISDTTSQRHRYDKYERLIQISLAEKFGISLERALNDLRILLDTEAKELIVIGPLVMSLRDYLEKKGSQADSSQLAEFGIWLHHWLGKNKGNDKAPYLFVLLNSAAFHSYINILDSEIVAMKTIKWIRTNRLRPWHFPHEYLKWRLSNTYDGRETEERPIINLLNKVWEYILHYSNKLHKEKGQLVNRKFHVYEKHFIPLLASYPVHKHESWWLKALEDAVAKYHENTIAMQDDMLAENDAEDDMVQDFDNFTIDTHRMKRYGVRNREHRDEETNTRRQYRESLDGIIETLISQLKINDREHGLSHSTTIEKLRAVFDPYKGQFWAQRWLAKLGQVEESSLTVQFIHYLKPYPAQNTPDVFSIEDHCRWWLDWVEASDNKLTEELHKVLEVLKGESFRSSSVIIPILSGLIRNSDLLQTSSSVLASLIERGIRRKGEFKEKSELLKYYLKYLLTFKKEIEAEELDILKKIVSWYLKNVQDKERMNFASYGLQSIFEVLRKFNLEIDNIDDAKKALLRVSASLLDDETGGQISKDYFSWFCEQGQPSAYIVEFIAFIKEHYEGQQVPYFMANMLHAFYKSKEQVIISKAAFEDCWQVLNSWLDSRQDDQGVSVASENFCEYLIKYDQLDDRQAYLKKIARETFSIALKRTRNKPFDKRISYLLTSFLPIWLYPSINYPTRNNIFSLWKDTLERLINSQYAETALAFGNFTIRLHKHLKEEKDSALLLQFHEEALRFIKEHLQHELSTKLCKLLCIELFRIDELLVILPNMIYQQKKLKDTKYAMISFFEAVSLHQEVIFSPDHKQWIEFEHSLIEALKDNLRKPYAGGCLLTFLEKCQLQHYAVLSSLFESYLLMSKEPEKERDEPKRLTLVRSFYAYEKRAKYEATNRKLEILSIIKGINQKLVAANYLSDVLETWHSEELSPKATIEIVNVLLREIDSTKWETFKKIYKKCKHMFDNSFSLSTDLDGVDVLFFLENDRRQGFIWLKQRIVHLI